jgi:hypothetical protein
LEKEQQEADVAENAIMDNKEIERVSKTDKP